MYVAVIMVIQCVTEACAPAGLEIASFFRRQSVFLIFRVIFLCWSSFGTIQSRSPRPVFWRLAHAKGPLHVGARHDSQALPAPARSAHRKSIALRCGRRRCRHGAAALSLAPVLSAFRPTPGLSKGEPGATRRPSCFARHHCDNAQAHSPLVDQLTTRRCVSERSVLRWLKGLCTPLRS